MRRKGYQLTRYADDWVITCESAAEARAAVAAALRILNELGVQLHPQKTRIVHVRQGFEFLGYKIKRGRQLRLQPGKIGSGVQAGALYAYPSREIDPPFQGSGAPAYQPKRAGHYQGADRGAESVLRGWGHHYKRAHVRRLFHQLDGWIVRRIWSHRFKRWRYGGWRQLPETKLYGEYGLVNLVRLSLRLHRRKRSLRESCMREICTCSLSGGRRPARSSAPPPTRHRGGRVMSAEERALTSGVLVKEGRSGD